MAAVLLEDISETNPISGGITAPPETAIIIKPEISFARSGNLPTVIEKINGKILATPNPMIKMIIMAVMSVGAKISPNIEISPNIDEDIKKFLVFNRANRRAPAKVPNILPKK